MHALDGEGVSLSLWYQHDGTFAESVRKDEARNWAAGGTRHSARVRIARESEEVVGAALGPKHVRTFFLRLAWYTGRHYPCATYRRGRPARRASLPPGSWPPVEYDGDGDDDALDAEPQLRNWLLHRLGELFGHEEVDAFLQAFLGERRFVGIP